MVWFNSTIRTLNDGHTFEDVAEGERVADAFARLLRKVDTERVQRSEAQRDRSAEARESLKRFRGRLWKRSTEKD